jgi:hypothetical protein
MNSRPAIGLIALTGTFLGQPLARGLQRLLLGWLGDWAIVAILAVGLAGIVLVAANLSAEENRATVAGFVGGLLIWRGFFDGPLRFFAERFSIPPIDYGGFPLGGRYALLMSSLTIMLALLILYGLMNRETKCNFMRWCLRLIRWSPGDPTPGLRRSFARITAMETVFVQWGIFLLFLFLGGWLGWPFYVLLCLWAAYLVRQLIRRRRAGEAYRYAIPISVIIWSLAEVGAFFGLYPEFWQAPGEYPLAMVAVLLLFVASLLPMLQMNRASDV